MGHNVVLRFRLATDCSRGRDRLVQLTRFRSLTLTTCIPRPLPHHQRRHHRRDIRLQRRLRLRPQRPQPQFQLRPLRRVRLHRLHHHLHLHQRGHLRLRLRSQRPPLQLRPLRRVRPRRPHLQRQLLPPTPTPAPCAVIALNENFDAVTAPALPAGWVSSFFSGPSGCQPRAICALGTDWTTSTTTPASSPNCAFHNAPSCVHRSRPWTRPPFPASADPSWTSSTLTM